MTAPAVAPAPVAAPAAPETPVAPLTAVPQSTPVTTGTGTPAPVEPAVSEKPVGLNAMIDKIARDTKMVDDAPVAEPQTPPAEGEPSAKPATPAESQTEPTGELVVDDGEVILRAERNADGTFKAQIDPSQKFDIQMKDPETGEMRTYTKNINEVLRMARDGVWGQKVKDEVSYYRNEVPKWQQAHEQLAQKVQQYEQGVQTLQEQLDAQMALNRELLTADDEIVIRRREEFAHEMSPEQRLAKLEARLNQEREQLQMTQRQQEHARQADAFIQTRLAPVLAQAEQALGGNDIARRMVAGQVALETTPLLVNGQLPPSAWPKLEAYLRGPFQQWVQAVTATQRAQATSGDDVRKAQATAQVAVNTAGQLLRPVGNVAASNARPSAPPTSMKDAMDRIINRPLAG